MHIKEGSEETPYALLPAGNPFRHYKTDEARYVTGDGNIISAQYLPLAFWRSSPPIGVAVKVL